MIRKIIIIFFGLFLFMPVYGMAVSPADISIDMYYLVVSPAEDGSTNMMNMVNYANSSSEPFKGDGTGEAVLKVTLPEDAEGLSFLDNKIPIKQTNFGFITIEPIPANQTVVLPYSYRMPKGKKIQLQFDYPAQLIQVLVPEGMGSVDFSGVTAINQGIFKFEDRNYLGYTAEGIKAGQTFSMVYNKDKQPEAANSSQGQTNNKNTSVVTKSAPVFHNPGHIRMWEQSPIHSFNPHLFLIVISAIIIAGISYYVHFRRKAKVEEERLGADKEEKEFQLLLMKQKAILDKILELEETRDNGEIPETVYLKKLGAYKEHLAQVKLRMRTFIE